MGFSGLSIFRKSDELSFDAPEDLISDRSENLLVALLGSGDMLLAIDWAADHSRPQRDQQHRFSSILGLRVAGIWAIVTVTTMLQSSHPFT